MLVQPVAELILDDAADERGGLARGEALLRLAGELRLLELGREHEADAVPHVFRRELQPLRQQVAELAELADRIGETDAQTVDVRAALRRRNQVDVAFLDARPVVDAPDHGPLGRFLLALDRAGEHFRRQPFALPERFRRYSLTPPV